MASRGWTSCTADQKAASFGPFPAAVASSVDSPHPRPLPVSAAVGAEEEHALEQDARVLRRKAGRLLTVFVSQVKIKYSELAQELNKSDLWENQL